MMGPYYTYFDTTFIEENPEVQTELHIHECMWSGECCSNCPPPVPGTRLTFPNNSVAAAISNGTVPITVGGTMNGGYFTVAATNQDNNLQLGHRHISWDDTKAQLDKSANEKSPEQADDVLMESDSQETSSGSSSPIVEPEKSIRVKVTKKRGLTKANFSSSDNKKLRHREVEKNRHRQLQAMVKTLSERIPGRLDKETQVQTMKRAARYCVYLRDLLQAIQIPNRDKPSISKEKLEMIYLRSCDYVERIMMS